MGERRWTPAQPLNCGAGPIWSAPGGDGRYDNVSKPDVASDRVVQEVHVGCQPVLDGHRGVFGYELLFNDPQTAQPMGDRAAASANDIIRNVFAEPNPDGVTRARLWFTTISRQYLTGKLEFPFDPPRVAMQVAADVEPDFDVLQAAKRLAGAGYRLALDDFVHGDGREQLLPYASYVKLDLATGDRDRLRCTALECAMFTNVTMIGKNIATEDQYGLAKAMRCRLFQGELLASSVGGTHRTLAPSRSKYFDLISAMDDQKCRDTEVLDLVSADPALSILALRACNAAFSGLTRRVSSIRQAVTMAGRSQLRRWVYLLLAFDLVGDNEAGLSSIIEWSRLCQLLGPVVGVPADTGFMVGLLVEAARVLGTPIADFVGQFPIDAKVTDGILERSGPIGTLIDIASGYMFNAPSSERAASVLPSEMVRRHQQAAAYADEMTTMIVNA